MTSPDRRKLIARVRQVSRLVAARDQAPTIQDASQPESVRALEARVAHLEQLVEGLQDSVHRESERHEKLIAEIQAKVQPGAMGAALADDARLRGL